MITIKTEKMQKPKEDSVKTMLKLKNYFSLVLCLTNCKDPTTVMNCIEICLKLGLTVKDYFCRCRKKLFHRFIILVVC